MKSCFLNFCCFQKLHASHDSSQKTGFPPNSPIARAVQQQPKPRIQVFILMDLLHLRSMVFNQNLYLYSPYESNNRQWAIITVNQVKQKLDANL